MLWKHAAGIMMFATATQASDRSTYKYDALGRLIVVERRATGGAAGNGSFVQYAYDAASNRTRVVASGPFKGRLLSQGETLQAGQALLSGDGRFMLLLQQDANLVLYDSSGVPIWYTGTQNAASHPGDRLALQSDGNLVLYRANDAPLWAAMSQGSGATRLIVQDDGNVVLYRSDGAAVWSSGTCCR